MRRIWLLLALFAAVYTIDPPLACPLLTNVANRYSIIENPVTSPGYVKNSACIQNVPTPAFTLPWFISFRWLDLQGGDSLVLTYPPITLTGRTMPAMTLQSGPYGTYTNIYAKFNTDALFEGNGFSMVFSQYPPVTCNSTLTFTDPAGNFSVPNITDYTWGFRYGPSANCVIKIQAQSGYTVGLTFTSFSTEAGKDIVTVYDTGYPAVHTSLGQFSGESLPVQLGSSGSDLTIKFTSDSVNEYFGFVFRWESVPAPTLCTTSSILTGTEGVIEPTTRFSGFTGYTTGNCAWSLPTRSSTQRVMIMVEYQSLPAGDSITIYDSAFSNGTVLATLTGALDESSSKFFTTGDEVLVVWTPGANPHTSYDGFSLSWELVGQLGCNPAATSLSSATGGSVDASGAFTNVGSTCPFILTNTNPAGLVRVHLPAMGVLADGDSVTLYDGGAVDPLKWIGVYTNLTSTLDIVSLSNTMTVILDLADSTRLTGPITWFAENTLPGQCLPETTSTATQGWFASSVPFSNATMLSGVFTCLMHIDASAQANSLVRYVLTDLFQQSGSQRLTFYDGPTASGNVLLDYFGNYPTRTPVKVTSTGSTMTIRFYHFKPDVLASGFQGYWNATTPRASCAAASVNLVGNVSQIVSVPDIWDGSTLYPVNINCTTLITVPVGMIPLVTFLNFSTESGLDFISLYSGTVPTAANLILTATGSALPPSISSPNRNMVFNLQSSPMFGYPGVRFLVQAINPPTQCSGRMSFNATTGSFSAPTPYSRATYYAPNLFCEWLISAPPGLVIRITFDDGGLVGDSFQSGLDNITFWDGGSSSAPLITSLFVSYQQSPYSIFPISVLGTTNQMLVRFQTDGSLQSAGFAARWTTQAPAIQCLDGEIQHIYAASGNILAPNGTGTFRVGLNCTWVIYAQPSDERLSFTFISLDVGPNTVYIYDGTEVDPLNGDVVVQGYQSLSSILSYGRAGPYSSSGPVATINFAPPEGNGGNYAGFNIFFVSSNATTDCLATKQFNHGETSGLIEAPIPYDGFSPQHPGQMCYWIIRPPSYYNQIVFQCIGDIQSQFLTIYALRNYSDPNWNQDLLFFIDGLCDGITRTHFAVWVAYVQIQFWLTTFDGPTPGFALPWRAVHVDRCKPLETQTGASGVVMSHYDADGSTLYLNFEDCTTHIVPSPDGGFSQIRVYIDFVGFYYNVGGHANVTVYAGDTAASPVLVAYNATTVAPSGGFLTSSTQLTVHFRADYFQFTDIGFRLRWTAGYPPAQCTSLLAGYSSGDIQAPVPYDGANRNTMTACNWVISAATGYTQVVVFFQAIKLAFGATLTLYDGANINTPVLATVTYTANDQPYLPIASTGASMFLTFRSPGNDYGFWMNWTSTYAPPLCSAFNFPADLSEGTLAYPPPWGDGFRYTNGLDCIFVLEGFPRLMFRMEHLSLQAGDTVTVYDAYHVKGPILQTFIKHPSDNPTFSAPLYSTQPYMIVRLQTTILSVPDYGFSGSYKPTQTPGQCGALNELPVYQCEYSGTINVPDPYDGVTGLLIPRTCVYHIYASPGTNNLRFTINGYISVGRYIRIWDGKYNGLADAPDNKRVLQTNGQVYASSPLLNIVTGPVATILFDGNYGTALTMNWTAFNDSGPRMTDCPLIPIPLPPPPPCPPPPPMEAAVQDSNLGPLIGGVLGGVGALILIIVAIVLIVRMQRRRRDRMENGDSTVKLDIGPDAQLKKRINLLLKASSTKQIGKGGTAVVYKAKMEDGQMVAMKQLIDTSVHAKVEFHKEVTIFSRLAGRPHPNVLGLVLFCNDPPVIVCDLAEKGSLHRMRKEFTNMDNSQRKAIMLQVCEGMRYLHENDIVHLDLKPENVLVGEGNVLKISDFGTSLILGADIPVNADGLSVVTTSFAGTPQYSAPERFASGIPIDLRRADVFSFGVLAWSVATGQVPFDGETGETIMQMHVSQRFDSVRSLPLDPTTDAMIADMIGRCIQQDFRKRPSFFEMAATIRENDPSSVPTINYSTLGSENRGRSASGFGSVAPLASITHNSVYTGNDSGVFDSGVSSSTFGSHTSAMDSTTALQTIAPAPPTAAPPPPTSAPTPPPGRGSSTKALPPMPPVDSPPPASGRASSTRATQPPNQPPTVPAEPAPGTPRKSSGANPFAKK